MLARQTRSSLALVESLSKASLCSRLSFAFPRRYGTEAPQPKPEQLEKLKEQLDKQALPLLMVTPEVPEFVYSGSVAHGRALLAPLKHRKRYGIPVATIHVRGYNHRDLDFFLHFASHAASSLAIPVSEIIRLPTQRSLWTVPKSPFVYKKAQENFERRVHKRMIKAWDATDTVVDRWIHYIRSHPQPGIGMRIVRWHRAPLGIGRKYTERASKMELESRKLENITDRQRVEEVARSIVEQEMAAADLGKPAPKMITQASEPEASAEETKPQN